MNIHTLIVAALVSSANLVVAENLSEVDAQSTVSVQDIRDFVSARKAHIQSYTYSYTARQNRTFAPVNHPFADRLSPTTENISGTVVVCGNWYKVQLNKGDAGTTAAKDNYQRAFNGDETRVLNTARRSGILNHGDSNRESLQLEDPISNLLYGAFGGGQGTQLDDLLAKNLHQPVTRVGSSAVISTRYFDLEFAIDLGMMPIRQELRQVVQSTGKLQPRVRIRGAKPLRAGPVWMPSEITIERFGLSNANEWRIYDTTVYQFADIAVNPREFSKNDFTLAFSDDVDYWDVKNQRMVNGKHGPNSERERAARTAIAKQHPRPSPHRLPFALLVAGSGLLVSAAVLVWRRRR